MPIPRAYKKPSFAQGFARSRGESAYPELWNGLVGAWVPALGVQGSKLFDVSGNGNDGTLTNMTPATDWIVTEKGHTIQFDSVANNYINIGNISLLDAPSKFTLACLFKSDSVTQSNKGIIGKWGSDSGYMLWISSFTPVGSLSMPINGGPHLIGTTDIRTGAWFSLVGTFDGSTAEIFVDGISEGSETKSVPTSNAVNFDIGRYADTTATDVNAQIPSAYVWDRALTKGEILELHINHLAPFELKRSPLAFVAGLAAQFDAVVSGSGDVSADLATDISMAAVMGALGGVSADLTTSIEMESVVTGSGDVTADLTFPAAQLQAVVDVSGDAIADLQTAIEMAASVSNSGDLIADLTTAIQFEAIMDAEGFVGADLQTAIEVAAVLLAEGDVIADLTGGAAQPTLSDLKYFTFEIGGGLTKTFLPSGNTAPVAVVTTAPSGAPPSNTGVVFQVSGGVVTIHVWDGTQWVTK